MVPGRGNDWYLALETMLLLLLNVGRAERARCRQVEHSSFYSYIPALQPATRRQVPPCLLQSVARKPSRCSKVAVSSHQISPLDSNIVEDHSRAILSNRLDRNSIRAKARAILKEVVLLSAQPALPAATTIGTDLQVLHSLRNDVRTIGGYKGVLAATYHVCAYSLHREPVRRHTFLHVDLQWAGDGALDVIPADIDDALASGRELFEGVLKEIEMVGATSGALIDDLP